MRGVKQARAGVTASGWPAGARQACRQIGFVKRCGCQLWGFRDGTSLQGFSGDIGWSHQFMQPNILIGRLLCQQWTQGRRERRVCLLPCSNRARQPFICCCGVMRCEELPIGRICSPSCETATSRHAKASHHTVLSVANDQHQPQAQGLCEDVPCDMAWCPPNF
jgi:hypothetical protein